MGGKKSRDKGARGERSLCMHLNMLEYDARRVIRTRAVGGYEKDVVPDVIATKDGREYTFEMKRRKNAFTTIYKLYQAERGDCHIHRFNFDGCISIGSDFDLVRDSGSQHFRTILPDDPKVKIYKRIQNLRKLLKGAQYLVIQDNNAYKLFLRFF